MPVFNLKLSHAGQDTTIQVRSDSEQSARDHVAKMHPFDILQHFKGIPPDAKKHHANRLESPFSSTVAPGAPLAAPISVVSIEIATEDCPGGCGGKRPAQ